MRANSDQLKNPIIYIRQSPVCVIVCVYNGGHQKNMATAAADDVELGNSKEEGQLRPHGTVTIPAEPDEESLSAATTSSSAAPASVSASTDGVAQPDPGYPKGPYDYPNDVGRYSMSKDVSPPPCYKRKVGRFYVCVDVKDETGHDVPCCMVGPCWPMMLLTASLIFGLGALAAGAFGAVLVRTTEGIVVLSVGLSCVAYTGVCFLCTACRNPGIYPRQLENTTGDMVWHEESKSWRPRRGVMFDSETRVLAYKIDHFCPWTGTLIARDNFCCFTNFTGCLMFACLGVGAILVFGLMQVNAHDSGRT